MGASIFLESREWSILCTDSGSRPISAEQQKTVPHGFEVDCHVDLRRFMEIYLWYGCGGFDWFWGLHSHGGSPNGWFLMEIPIQMDDDWGYPHFRKPLIGPLPKGRCLMFLRRRRIFGWSLRSLRPHFPRFPTLHHVLKTFSIRENMRKRFNVLNIVDLRSMSHLHRSWGLMFAGAHAFKGTCARDSSAAFAHLDVTFHSFISFFSCRVLSPSLFWSWMRDDLLEVKILRVWSALRREN